MQQTAFQSVWIGIIQLQPACKDSLGLYAEAQHGKNKSETVGALKGKDLNV